METDKTAMRRIYRQKRDEFVSGLSPQEYALAFSRVPTPMLSHLQPGKIIAGYIAKDSEANPAALLLAAHENGCGTALPHITTRTAPMQFLRWSPGDPLEDGPFGLLQPQSDAESCSPDVVLAPLVAFDSRLMRLGQGAGHYDRALSLLDPCFAIGIAWSVQHAPALETDPWDVPMDAVLTEKSWMTI
ncbi:MAG: 5-formyltetrahydrofolate cyclo-ligase [Sphingorhabdus sp.]